MSDLSEALGMAAARNWHTLTQPGVIVIQRELDPEFGDEWVWPYELIERVAAVEWPWDVMTALRQDWTDKGIDHIKRLLVLRVLDALTDTD